MSTKVTVRAGKRGDGAAVLALWDAAIAWLVERGQASQWGTQPASTRSLNLDMVREWETGTGLRLAEIDGDIVGASVLVATRPDYVPATAAKETYLLFLVSDRTRAGAGIGAALVRRAAADARAAGSEVLRVDCWADAPDLVAWYQRQGFTKSATFTVGDGWRGQLFEMEL